MSTKNPILNREIRQIRESGKERVYVLFCSRISRGSRLRSFCRKQTGIGQFEFFDEHEN